MEALQILLTLTIGAVAIILAIAGIQLIIVLQDVKTLLRKIDFVIEEFEKIGERITGKCFEAAGFFSGLKNIFHLINFLIKKTKKDDK